MPDCWKIEFHVHDETGDPVAWHHEDDGGKRKAISEAEDLSKSGKQHTVHRVKYFNTDSTQVWPEKD